MDFGKKVKQGVEDEPIVAPTFTPVKKEPELIPMPDYTRVPVPVRRSS